MERTQWSLPTIRYRSIVDVYPTKSRTDGGNLENREIVDYRRYDPIIIGVVSRDTWGDGISFQDLRVGLHELMVVAIGFQEPAGGQYRVSSHDVHQYLLATSWNCNGRFACTQGSAFHILWYAYFTRYGLLTISMIIKLYN